MRDCLKLYIYIYIKRERWPKCKTQKKNCGET